MSDITDTELAEIERETIPGTSKAKLLAAVRSEHAQTRGLLHAIDLLADKCETADAELERERTQNRELRAALERVQVVNPPGPDSHANRAARAALSTQEESK